MGHAGYSIDGPMATVAAGRPVNLMAPVPVAPSRRDPGAYSDPKLIIGDPNLPQRDGNSFPRGEPRSLNEPCPIVGVTGQSIGGALRYHLEGVGPEPTITRETRGQRPATSTVTIGSPGNDLPVPHVEPESDISRYAIGDEADNLAAGQTSAKYFQLERADPDQPSPAILSASGGGSIASVIHPTEKRKFSIAELKRICSWPDDAQIQYDQASLTLGGHEAHQRPRLCFGESAALAVKMSEPPPGFPDSGSD